MTVLVENKNVVLSVKQLGMFSRICGLLGKGWVLKIRAVDIPEGYSFCWKRGDRSVVWRSFWGDVVECGVTAKWQAKRVWRVNERDRGTGEEMSACKLD